MQPNDNDNYLYDLIRDAAVPVGLRPILTKDMQSMMDTIGGDPFTDEEIERILAKVARPHAIRRNSGSALTGTSIGHSDNEVSRELLALHRSEAGELPPEIKKKLEELRRKATEEPDQQEDNDDAEPME